METIVSIIAALFLLVFYSLGAISIICVIAHLYKFYKTNIPQSLATKNLTFYCAFLLITYVTEFTHIVLPEMDLKDAAYQVYVFLLHLMVTTTLIKFIIAIDLCVCFRNINLYLRKPSSGTQNKKFILYCLLGTCIPMLYTLIWLIFSKGGYETTSFEPHLIMRVIRIARLFSIVVAFWYLRISSINRTELWLNYGLHMRLLMMLGGFSAVISVAEVVLLNVPISIVDDASGDEKTFDGIEYYFYYVYLFGNVLEGIFIAVLFTFRKNTFKSSGTLSPQTSISITRENIT